MQSNRWNVIVRGYKCSAIANRKQPPLTFAHFSPAAILIDFIALWQTAEKSAKRFQRSSQGP